MFISDETKETLVDKLQACSSVANRAQREDVLSHIPDTITRRIVRGNTDQTDVMHIIEKCSEFDDGIERLVLAIQLIEGSTSAWLGLDKFVHKKFPKIVYYAERQQLLSIAKDIPEDILRKAYLDSLPQDYEDRPRGDLDILLKELAKIPPQQDQTFPVLEFVERLAVYAQGQQALSTRDKLSDWASEKANALGIVDAQLRVLREKAANSRTPVIEESPYLLITLESADDANVYNVQMWLLDNHYQVIRKAEEAFLTFQGISDMIDQFIEECLSDEVLVSTMSDLVIEFSLPRSLLCCAVDHLLVNPGFLKVELGVQYKVVVRSLERACKRKMWAAWKQKWQIFQKFVETQQAITSDLIWIPTEEPLANKSLYARLYGSSIICFVLTHVPPAFSEQNTHVFDVLLTSGIPIALWPRKQIKNPEMFNSFLSHDTVYSLPRLVWEQRKKAMEAYERCETDHVGSNLTLLWDDPSRLPPSVTAGQLAPPTRKG